MAPGLVVLATLPMPDLPAALEAEIASIWERETARRPALFNGTVFSVRSLSAGRIEGGWTEYRRALAQLREPRLEVPLQIRPLAVTGLISCADGFVLGRREANSLYQPGMWQSPPAGSVERREAGASDGPVDLEPQILAECEEELGLDGRDVRVLRPVLAFTHAKSRIIDVGFRLETPLAFEAVERAWRARGNREYDRLHRLATHDAPMPEAAVAPSTLALLAQEARPGAPSHRSASRRDPARA